MKKILLVEDNDVNRELVREMLDGADFEVFEAVNGLEALHMLPKTSPDLVLLDIQMPVLDGMSTIKQIRLKPQYAQLPVLALTAYAMVGDRERVLAAGFTGYISKPISRSTLLAEVNQSLSKVAVNGAGQ
ncbi:MAG TPA: response regulator [Terriglobales bacterium]|nr:response regulator [Terriglobales bacterium]